MDLIFFSYTIYFFIEHTYDDYGIILLQDYEVSPLSTDVFGNDV